MFLGQMESEKDGVRISVNVRASVYTYKITNLSAPPITRFEVQQHMSYNFEPPVGWAYDKKSDRFLARVEDLSASIHRGETGIFSLRVSSKGAVLGLVKAKIGFDYRDDIVITDIWGPVAESRNYLYLIIGILTAILLIHIFLLHYRY